MLSLAALLSMASASWCDAQDRRSPQAEKQACRNAARIVETGRPAQKVAFARELLRECGGAVAGDAAASVTLALRAERDTSKLIEAVNPFFGLQDTAFYRAASQLVQDRSASPEARVAAIRNLLGMLYQGVYAASYTSMMTEGAGCAMAGHTGMLPPDGTGLPPGAEAHVSQLLTAIAADETEPVPVRSAAGCARGIVGR